MTEVSNAQLLAAIAKLEGRVEGQTELVRERFAHAEQRLNDKFDELSKQYSRLEQDISGIGGVARQAQQDSAKALGLIEAHMRAHEKADEEARHNPSSGLTKRGRIESAGVGAGTSAVVAVFVEGLKALFGGH